jgi:hypothetical protein
MLDISRTPGPSAGPSQLTRIGIPGTLAEVYADRIDWHQIARLIRGGCPARLALRIVV